MTSDELPPVGSVWRYRGTGCRTEVTKVNEHAIEFLREPFDCSPRDYLKDWCRTEQWLEWQRNAVCVDEEGSDAER